MKLVNLFIGRLFNCYKEMGFKDIIYGAVADFIKNNKEIEVRIEKKSKKKIT
jgi:hypothetical protein